MRFSPNIMANYLIAFDRYDAQGIVVVQGLHKVTRRELRERCFRLADALVQLGVRKNDKVSFMFHNTPQFVELNYAVQVAGAVPVPLNYRFTALEVERQVTHSDARVLVYDEPCREAVEAAAGQLGHLTALVRRGQGAARQALDYEALVRSGRDQDPGVPTVEDDTAVMIYTGGTTGLPKGVMLTYGAHVEMFAGLLSSIVSRVAKMDLSPEQLAGLAQAAPIPFVERLLPLARLGLSRRLMSLPATIRLLHRGLGLLMRRPELARIGYGRSLGYMVPSLPFFHDASYQVLMLGALVGCLCFVLNPEVRFDPPTVIQAIEKDRPFLLGNVPTGWKKLVTCPEIRKHDVSSVRVAITGAGICPLPLKQQIFECFPGAIIIDMFGQTEMTPVTSFRIDASPDTLKERSVGRPFVQVRLLDEKGREVPQGQIGEIAYRSPTVMKGYYKDHEATRRASESGWFLSGDLGYLDEEGEMRVVERKKECINTGGEKVFPLEVEEVIQQHPSVEVVCVIGVPDEQWGHSLRAVVQLRPRASATAEELIDFSRAKLAGFKIPRSVVFVPELPLSPVGKLLRERVRQLFG